MYLIPQPGSIQKTGGALNAAAICYHAEGLDPRLIKALATLPFDKNGAPLTLRVGDSASEDYTLSVKKSGIAIEAGGRRHPSSGRTFRRTGRQPRRPHRR